MRSKEKGFTLIEVLTVVMIIGILASVILVSMDTARQRTADVTIQNQVGQLRSLAEGLYTFHNHYADFREASTGGGQDGAAFTRVKNEIDNLTGEESALEVYFSNNNRHYCMVAPLMRNDDEVFCVDSRGDAVIINTVTNEPDGLSCTNAIADATNDEDVVCRNGGGGGGGIPCIETNSPCDPTTDTCCDSNADCVGPSGSESCTL